jgi:hypothetical protein
MEQLAVCKRDVEQARQQGDREREAQALIALGKVHQEKGRRKLALEAWRAASSLLHTLGHDVELAELYERMAGDCLDMGWTDKSCEYYRWAHDLYLKLGHMPQVGRLFVQIGALENWGIDENKRSFQMARVVFRGLSDLLWVARSYLVQARTYWRRGYDEESLGYLRYAQELLAGLQEDEGERDRAADDIETVRQLEVYFSTAYRSEGDYAQAQVASFQAYEEAKGEEEAMRKAMEEYHRDRLPDIERLGLLRHEVSRTEAAAAPALQLIERFGYSAAALASYEKVLPQLRGSHNRLAEAIIEGTITLLRILLRERHASSESAIDLYLEAHADPLGLGRTHFNAAIHSTLLGETHADSALASLWRAEDLLGEAEVPRGEMQHVRAKRVELKRQLGPTAYTRARKSALEAYARLKEESCQVSIYRAETAEEFEDVEKTGVCIGEADNFLAALLQVLDLLTTEGWETQPRQITLLALRRYQYQLKGTTTGRSLTGAATPEQQHAAEKGPVFRVRLLELPIRGPADGALEELLGRPLRVSRQSEVLQLSRRQLEAIALDHLDRRCSYLDDDRALEVLDEADRQVWLLRSGAAH